MENYESFFHSCQEGILAEVVNFLSKGLSPDVQNAEGETALQISAANGYVDIVTFLLNKGASVDLSNNYGWTPLMHAARYGHVEIVSLLIRKKAKINISNRLGVRPIDIAAWYGNLSCLKLIIEAGAIIDNISLIGLQNDLCDISSLMVASLKGHTAIIKKLLEEGSSISQASPITGLTPLMLASCNGHRTIVEILIEYGSDANVTDICGRTALDLATLCGREDVVIFLKNVTQETLKKLASDDTQDNILRIVRSGDTAKIKSLLQKVPSLSNYADPDDGVTPLMITSMLGFVEILDILISSGADLNAQDTKNGWTPLMYAVFHRQAEVVHLLLDKGVDIDIYTSNGYTALDLALHIDSSETDILETLLAHSGTEELLDTEDYLDVSSSSTFKSSNLTVQKPSSRSDSQAKFKDLLGGFSSHFRSFSRSSTVSPTVDLEVSDEVLYDVFADENAEKAPTNKKFLCVSKFYAPNERFAHLLKEQKEEAIDLPPLPSHNTSVGLINNPCSKKDLTDENMSSKPHINSLRVPNLIRRIKENSLVGSNNIFKECMFSKRNCVDPYIHVLKSLDVQDISNFTAISAYDLEPNSSLQSKNDDELRDSHDDFESTLEGTTLENISRLHEETVTNFSRVDNKDFSKSDSNKEVEVAAEGLTALLDQESLKKYAEKFRDQEIDLETFQYLTEEDLNEIGINSFNSRHKLMEIIDKLKNS